MIDMKKTYKTRAGQKVRVLATDLDSHYPVAAAVTSHGGQVVFRFTKEGHALSKNVSNSNDLIEVKPVREGWINIYSRPSAGDNLRESVGYPGNSIFASREDADYWAANNNRGRRDRLACIKIQFTEGEGL